MPKIWTLFQHTFIKVLCYRNIIHLVLNNKKYKIIEEGIFEIWKNFTICAHEFLFTSACQFPVCNKCINILNYLLIF